MTTTDDAHHDERGRELDYRPWGAFWVLDDERGDHKVKRLVVEPGKRLSYQRHRRRAEHWFVVAGVATVVLDGEEFTLGPGQSTDIAVGQAHRCENRGTEPVTLVEVQTGTYFGEDDIERLEDDFGRAG